MVAALKSPSSVSFLTCVAMAFMRSSTSASLVSKAWSTRELGEGIAHILTDGRMELPDDAAQLQDQCDCRCLRSWPFLFFFQINRSEVTRTLKQPLTLAASLYDPGTRGEDLDRALADYEAKIASAKAPDRRERT